MGKEKKEKPKKKNEKDESLAFLSLKKQENEELLGIDRRSNRNNYNRDMGLFSFLETESSRQDKLYDFFENKLPLVENYPQAEKLQKRQKDLNNILRKELLEEISRPSSHFQKNMVAIFQSYFQKKKRAK